MLWSKEVGVVGTSLKKTGMGFDFSEAYLESWARGRRAWWVSLSHH
jgi:hypothetical protein